MKLDRVTITGADDSVEPKHLAEISEEYPFVEWGILLSSKHITQGSYRFPSRKWLGILRPLMNSQIKCSAHLCGEIVRSLSKRAEWTYPISFLDGFQRIQINFHGEPIKFHDLFFDVLLDDKQFILQIDDVNDNILYKGLYYKKNVVPLFDKSHGAGVLPESWPKPISGIYNGYAGGLGPDNLKEEIEKISNIAGEERIWIDMETKIRSNDDRKFDLDKVIECLEIAKEYINGSS